ELLSRLVRDKAPHLVSHQPQRRRLQAQGQRRGTGVIGAEVIFRTGLAQDGVATNDYQYRRTLAPQLVLLQQAVEGAFPGSLVATPVADDVTPGLIVVAGRSPARGLNESQQVGLGNRPVRIEGNTAVALGKQGEYRYGSVDGFWNHGAGSRQGS